MPRALYTAGMGRLLTYRKYEGEQPVFECSAVKPAGQRVAAFYVSGFWIRLIGIDGTGVQVVTFDGCWAMYNGFSKEKEQLGDGFNLGEAPRSRQMSQRAGGTSRPEKQTKIAGQATQLWPTPAVDRVLTLRRNGRRNSNASAVVA